MNTLTTTDLQTLARKAADYITFTCRGEADSFEVEHKGYVAFVSYKPEYRDAIGGSYENYEFEHISELVSETVEVASVWDEKGNECPELAEALQMMLN